jgi:triacylglycerol lipase
LTPKIIHDVGEVPLVLYSEVRAPLASLSFLRRGLLFAELSMIAYNDEAEARRAAEAIGFPEAQLFDHDGSQAYRFRNEHDVVLACRGTEPNEWNDIQADANVGQVLLGEVGRVHRGFNREVDDLWPMLEDLLRDDPLPAWFCGHSLGAAMATICAYRCLQSSICDNPQELHTFGSPRVGCRRFIRQRELSHFRWVHNNDIVTRVPPVWMGYRHGGDEVYLDRHGRIKKLRGFFRSRDRWRGLLRGLLEWRIDLLSDHSVRQYAGHIAAAVEKDEDAIAQGAQAADADDVAMRAKRSAPSEGEPCDEEAGFQPVKRRTAFQRQSGVGPKGQNQIG